MESGPGQRVPSLFNIFARSAQDADGKASSPQCFLWSTCVIVSIGVGSCLVDKRIALAVSGSHAEWCSQNVLNSNNCKNKLSATELT